MLESGQSRPAPALALHQPPHARHAYRRRHRIRRIGISEQTFYRWKKQYSGLDSDQARQLKQLQEVNERLKKIVAELSLDKAMLADVIKKSGENG